MNEKFKFHDGADLFKQRLSKLAGSFVDNKGNITCQFRSSNGGVVNLYGNGTIQFQSVDDVFIEKVKNLLVSNETIPEKSVRKNIFIVHGHDHTCLDEVELLLRRVKLDPYVLINNDNSGKTIIEALEESLINDNTIGIVLMTPDDYGKSKRDSADKDLEPRARQNVILELGILIGAVGRKNIIVLKKGHLELPSDISGLLYIEFNDSVKEKSNDLLSALRNKGISIDPDDILRANK